MKYVIEKSGNKEKIISVRKKKIALKKIIKFYKNNEYSTNVYIVLPKDELSFFREIRGFSERVKDKINFEDFTLD